MEEESRRNDNVKRSGRIWQNFQVYLRIPVPVYCPEQYWFMIDEYSVAVLLASGKAKFSSALVVKIRKQSRDSAGTTRSFLLQVPIQTDALDVLSNMLTIPRSTRSRPMRNFGNLSRTRSLVHIIYANDLQDLRPVGDLMEFLRRCCPIAYKSVGKVVSAYGGIRCTPEHALDFPVWGKAKQLTWDRAYDQTGNLCYIAYYDAGNAAYAGFIKTLLSPQERVELFRGNENPREELPGDVMYLSSRWAFLHSRSDSLVCSINGGMSIPSTPASMGWRDASSGILPEKALHSLHQELQGNEYRRKQTPRSRRKCRRSSKLCQRLDSEPYPHPPNYNPFWG